MSKASDKSSISKTVTDLLSNAAKISVWNLRRAVSVELYIWVIELWKNTISNIFDIKVKLKIVL